MIDIAILRTQRDALAAPLARRGVDFDLDALTDLDERRRQARVRAEEVRANQKAAGKAIATLVGEEKAEAIADASQLAEDYKALIADADALDEQFNSIWVQLPNMTDPTAADGLEEEDAVEIRTVGSPRIFDFDAKDHVELGAELGVLDVERASKVSPAVRVCRGRSCNCRVCAHSIRHGHADATRLRR